MLVKTAEKIRNREDCGGLLRLQQGIRKRGRIVGACEDCSIGIGKWGGLWVLVQTAAKEDCSNGIGKWGGFGVCVKTAAMELGDCED